MQADIVVHDFLEFKPFSILSSKFVRLNCSVLQSLCIVVCVCVVGLFAFGMVCTASCKLCAMYNNCMVWCGVS